MAKEAQRMLDGTGWLPEPLRSAAIEPAPDPPTGEVEALPAFLAGDDEETAPENPEEPRPRAIAAE
jgi:ParB family chromosome partitioning protein